ncbi:hypothetical protein MHU86_3883 [Fragilaria crotonensis]|nr:hypothetical protein MHU86_3883 [Fragilaria crotonensis]
MQLQPHGSASDHPRTHRPARTPPGALAFFARRNRRRNARLSSGTTAMDNSDITDEESEDSLCPTPGGGDSAPSTIACDPKTRGDCPRFRTDIAVGIVRFPAAPFSSTTSNLPFRDRQPPSTG